MPPLFPQRSPRRRIPCRRLRALPVPERTGLRVVGYHLFWDRLPSGDPRITRYLGEAAVRLPDGAACLADVVRIGGSHFLEVELLAWSRRGLRRDAGWDDSRLAALLRLIEQRHLLATGRRHGRAAGRN